MTAAPLLDPLVNSHCELGPGLTDELRRTRLAGCPEADGQAVSDHLVDALQRAPLEAAVGDELVHAPWVRRRVHGVVPADRRAAHGLDAVRGGADLAHCTFEVIEVDVLAASVDLEEQPISHEGRVRGLRRGGLIGLGLAIAVRQGDEEGEADGGGADRGSHLLHGRRGRHEDRMGVGDSKCSPDHPNPTNRVSPPFSQPSTHELTPLQPMHSARNPHHRTHRWHAATSQTVAGRWCMNPGPGSLEAADALRRSLNT